MTPPQRLRALLDQPEFVVMPAIWDGLSAKLTSQAGFASAFLPGSCVAATRLGGPVLDLITATEMLDACTRPAPRRPSCWSLPTAITVTATR